MIPIEGLFETHLTVANLDRSVTFYRDVLGLSLASRFDDRECAFFWIGPQQQALLGLWESGSGPQRMQLHTAFRVELQHLLTACDRLLQSNIVPLDFDGRPTSQPVVLGWMPAAAIYFRDPDGNLLEFLTMLQQQPRPEFGILTWTDWQERTGASAGGVTVMPDSGNQAT